MEELKNVIAKNIVTLRRTHNMTQAAFARKLNYTDKAVSKWERGESVPDVTVLKQIADMFGVTVDYLLAETHSVREDRSRFANHLTIEAISCVLVYAMVTIAFFALKLTLRDTSWLWKLYIVAAPVCFLILLIFNSIWGRIKFNYFIISAMLWTLLSTFYIFFDMLMIFVLGIPVQIIILLWTRFKFPTKDDPGFIKKKPRD